MRGFEGVQQLARDYAWAVDMELCVFPQEGIAEQPRHRGPAGGRIAPRRPGDRRRAVYRHRSYGGRLTASSPSPAPMTWISTCIWTWATRPDGMQAEYVCRKTEEHGWGGRVAIGHVSQASLLPPGTASRPSPATLAGAGVAVTVLPATDLFLTGRTPRPCGPARRAACRRHAARGRGDMLRGDEQRAQSIHALRRCQPAAHGEFVSPMCARWPARWSWPAAWT